MIRLPGNGNGLSYPEMRFSRPPIVIFKLETPACGVKCGVQEFTTFKSFILSKTSVSCFWCASKKA